MSTLLDLEAAKMESESEFMTPKEPTAAEVDKMLREWRKEGVSKAGAEEQIKQHKATMAVTRALPDGGRKMRYMIALKEAALPLLHEQQSKAWLATSLVGPSSDLEQQKFNTCCPGSQPGLLQMASGHSTQGNTAGAGTPTRLGSLNISQVQGRSPRLASQVRPSLSLRNWPHSNQ